jgi:hypothetical protein
VNIPKSVSIVEFLPKLRKVSTQTTGNMIKLIIGINNKTVHHVGRLMIFINTMELYIGTKASHLFLPAFSYNFHVPNP